MDIAALLIESHGRVGQVLHRAVGGLDLDQLTWRADPDANTIAWLAWHAGRGEDAQVAGAAGTEQVWTAQGWVGRFALPFDVSASGYGQSSQEVGQVRASGDLLLAYYDAVAAATTAFLDDLGEDDLDRIVDTRWDPPVTLGVRLVSVISDSLQHAGQASLVRGLLQRAT
ncbi:mycothiol transferase [Cellulomonas sp. McL0617]|uniref:mycothiol transferase n=1 Tax=Cellulomonas sp. McL0617 TaxID=3415675 RepID=UPI003CF232F9